MATLSNAQSLRVIGQDLVVLGIDTFNLARSDDGYTVWIEKRRSDKVRAGDKRFAKKIIQMILGDDPSAAPAVPKALRFASSQILWADVARQFNRKASEEIADLNELSLLLRALGNFLDKNQADDFTVSWSNNSVKVVFDNREAKFNLLDLYNIGTHMYLKRSNRRSPG